MDIRIDDDDLMDIINEVFEDVIVEDSSDEEDASSDDSAYNSDGSENLEEDIVERVVPFSELRALNLNTRHCMIQFYYYSIEEPGICASCVIRFRDNEMGVLHAARHHETGALGALNGVYCTQCAMPMFTYIPRNMCSICAPPQ